MQEVIKNENGYLVKIAYQLKDLFKASFKTAKWNAEQKMWQIGPRSLKKFELFLEQVNETTKEIEAFDEEEFCEKELTKLKYELAKIKEETKKSRKKLERTSKYLEEIQKIQNELFEAKEALDKQKIEEKEEKNKASKLLNEVCDVKAIFEAKEKISTAYNMLNSNRKYAKNLFEDAMNSLLKQRRSLKEKGILNKMIETLYYCNINRADRDHPNYIKDELIYEFQKIEE